MWAESNINFLMGRLILVLHGELTVWREADSKKARKQHMHSGGPSPLTASWGDPLNVNKQTSSVSVQQRQNTKLHLWIHVLVEFTLIQRQRILCVLVNARKMCISLASAVLKAGLVMFPKNPQEVYKMGYISQWSRFLTNAVIINMISFINIK